MTNLPINEYAHVAIDHIDTKETHIGRLIHVRGLFASTDVNCYTFESGYQTYATEDGVRVLGYEWPKGLWFGTVQFPTYRHTGLYFVDDRQQLHCFTYKKTAPHITEGESIHTSLVGLVDVIYEDIKVTGFLSA